MEIPPNVALYLDNEIKRRTRYKEQKETMKQPPSYDLVDVAEYQAEQARLEKAMADILKDVIALMLEYYPALHVKDNPELTLAGILEILPPPEKIVRVKQISARGQR